MPLTNTLFFVHIPKTAGTSLRLALEGALGNEHISYDYGPQSPLTDPAIKRLGYPHPDLFLIERSLMRKRCKLLAGHVNAQRYMPMVYALRTFTFLRNPVDQLLSHYEHHVRHYDYDQPLGVFIKKPLARNRLSTTMLKGVPLEALGFVGITEQFEPSLNVLAQHFGLTLPVRYDNRNPTQVESQRSYSIPAELKAEITELLAADHALWQRAQTLLQARQDAAKNGYQYVHGAIQSLGAHGISGFAFAPRVTKPIKVSILVNDKPAGRPSSAMAHRPALYYLHVPRNGSVGFDVRLRTTLRAGDVVKCVIPTTGQILDERVYQPTGTNASHDGNPAT